MRRIFRPSIGLLVIGLAEVFVAAPLFFTADMCYAYGVLRRGTCREAPMNLPTPTHVVSMMFMSTFFPLI